MGSNDEFTKVEIKEDENNIEDIKSSIDVYDEEKNTSLLARPINAWNEIWDGLSVRGSSNVKIGDRGGAKEEKANEAVWRKIIGEMEAFLDKYYAYFWVNSDAFDIKNENKVNDEDNSLFE